MPDRRIDNCLKNPSLGPGVLSALRTGTRNEIMARYAIVHSFSEDSVDRSLEGSDSSAAEGE